MGTSDTGEQGNATSATGGPQQEARGAERARSSVPDYCRLLGFDDPRADLGFSTANRYSLLSATAGWAARRSYQPGPSGELGRVASGWRMRC
jgi:hypothetical protein